MSHTLGFPTFTQPSFPHWSYPHFFSCIIRFFEEQARLNARRGGAAEAEGSAKKDKKDKKDRKDRKDKTKRKHGHEGGGSKKSKKAKADEPVSLSSFFKASSSDESD